MFASNPSKKFHIFCFMGPQKGIKDNLSPLNMAEEEGDEEIKSVLLYCHRLGEIARHIDILTLVDGDIVRE